MSQLKKNKTVIFLISFIVTCVIITIIAIYLTNEGIITFSQSDIPGEDPPIIISDGLGIKTLEDQYIFNNLELVTKKYQNGKKKVYTWGEEYPLEIEYLQIEGLKNKEVQDRINQEIKNIAFHQVTQEEQNNPKIDRIYIQVYCQANFSNILSLHTVKETRKKGKTENVYEYADSVGMNYNLATGEKLTFSDLFTNDANIKSILSQSAYTTFAEEYLNKRYEDENFDWDGDMNKIDYSEIEDNVLKIVQSYDKDKQPSFYFNERFIFALIGGKQITINMRDFYHQIAIYHRFAKTEGLYEKIETQSRYVFIPKDDKYMLYRKLGKIGDNLFVDVVLQNFDYEEENISKQDKKVQEYINQLEKRIEECKTYLKKNPDKAIVLSLYQDVQYNEGVESNHLYGAKAIMSKEYYQSTYFNKVLEWEQTEHQVADVIGKELMTLLYNDKEENKNIKVYEENSDTDN